MERRWRLDESHWTFFTNTTVTIFLSTYYRIISFILPAMTASSVSIQISPSPVGDERPTSKKNTLILEPHLWFGERERQCCRIFTTNFHQQKLFAYRLIVDKWISTLSTRLSPVDVKGEPTRTNWSVLSVRHNRYRPIMPKLCPKFRFSTITSQTCSVTDRERRKSSVQSWLKKQKNIKGRERETSSMNPIKLIRLILNSSCHSPSIRLSNSSSS